MKIFYCISFWLLAQNVQAQFIANKLYTKEGKTKETIVFSDHGTYERTVYPAGKGRVFQRTAEYTLEKDTLKLIYESISQEMLTVEDLIIKETPITNRDSIYIDFELKDKDDFLCTEINCALETEGFKSFSAGKSNLNIPNKDYTVSILAGTKYSTTVAVKKGFNYKLTMMINPYYTFIIPYSIDSVNEKSFILTDTLGEEKKFVLVEGLSKK